MQCAQFKIYTNVTQSAAPESVLKEGIQVISCGYVDETDWGSEVCFRFGFNFLNLLR